MIYIKPHFYNFILKGIILIFAILDPGFSGNVEERKKKKKKERTVDKILTAYLGDVDN